MQRKKILLTGATGFLGQEVKALLLQHFEVITLGRSDSSDLKGNIEKWNCDINLDLVKNTYENKIDHLVHIAALYDLKASEERITLTNVVGLHNIVELAKQIGIKNIINISSIAAGITNSHFNLNAYDKNLNAHFPDPYSSSKAHGESYLEVQSDHFNKIVNLRMGILIGDSRQGSIRRIDGPYFIPEFIRKNKMILKYLSQIYLPLDSNMTLPLLPVDVAASAVEKFCFLLDRETIKNGYTSYNLTPGESVLVSDLIEGALNAHQLDHLKVSYKFRIPKHALLKLGGYINFPTEEMVYSLNFKNYESTDTQALLGINWCPSFQQYKEAFWRGYGTYVSNLRG